ncbi:MAG: microcystin degradation protein MlrC, partial [Rhodospirillaceae bacterium]|nr:microcystin degradation protein MlrC [Rhodospirillaceae bacterium]
MARIAVGGFQHETNTFAPVKADFDAFAQADAWPALTRGDGLFDAVAGINLPLAGFVEAAGAAGHELLPLSWCSASPSAHVTEDAFERVSAMLLEDIAAAKPDAVYLDLHGAM